MPICGKRVNFYIVEPMLLSYMFCTFLNFPVEQQLVYRKVCLQEFKNETICDIINKSDNISITGQNTVQKNSAKWGIYLDMARSLPALVITLFYGAISDRLGRKVVMILPVIGDLSNIVFQLINSYFMDWHVGYLLFGVMFSACFGGFACFLSAVFAYVADLTDKTARTKRVNILEAMIYLGGIISTLTGGLLLDRYGFVAVYSLMICIYGCQIVYWIFLSESYLVDNKAQSSFIKSLFDFDRLRETFQVIKHAKSRMEMFLYFSCFALSISLFVGILSVYVLYLLHAPLNFTPAQIGFFFAEYSAAKFIGLLVLTFILVEKLQWKDYTVVFVSGVSFCAFNLSMSLVKTRTEVYLAVLCSLALGLSGSTRSALSKLVSPNEQGRLFSMLAVTESFIVASVGPFLKYIYEVSVDVSPSIVYYVMAACSSLFFLFAGLLKFLDRNDNYLVIDEHENAINM